MAGKNEERESKKMIIKVALCERGGGMAMIMAFLEGSAFNVFLFASGAFK